MKRSITIILAGILLLAVSCKKQDDFLAAKPNANLTVPATIQDCQLLMQDEQVFNYLEPGLAEISSDDYYVKNADLSSRATPQERNGYIWGNQVYNAGSNVSDWSNAYQQVYYANTVLDMLPKLQNTGSAALYNQVKGEALFYRSYAFYNLVQTFALPYNSKTATTDLGIPLRLNSILTTKSVRATEQQCYDQITNDLKESVELLPQTSAFKTMPTQPAADAMLARVFLAIGDYGNAFAYADKCLSMFNTLTDFNTLNPSGIGLISGAFPSEDIFHTTVVTYDIFAPDYVGITDSTLYASYQTNDLRKKNYFIINNGLPYYTGTYDYYYSDFNGLATDEMYLIRAECNARAGNTTAAITDLNTLLKTRWLTGTFVPYSAVSADDALRQILIERRKELIFRCIRWTDLRRLNQDPRFAVTLKRVVNGNTYTLPPNDVRYAWPIPDNEIQQSGIPQNAR